jgi:hypothetical protein
MTLQLNPNTNFKNSKICADDTSDYNSNPQFFRKSIGIRDIPLVIDSKNMTATIAASFGFQNNKDGGRFAQFEIDLGGSYVVSYASNCTDCEGRSVLGTNYYNYSEAVEEVVGPIGVPD